RQLAYFVAHVPRELAFVGLLPAALGLAFAIRRAPKLAALTSTIAIVTIVYAGGYGIRDIDPYFLGVYLVLGVWIALGLLALAESWRPSGALAAGLAGALLAGA